MERTKCVLIVSIFACLSLNAASYKQLIYKAYIGNDMASWQEVISELEIQANKSNEQVLELLTYQYGYIGWAIGQKEWLVAKELTKRFDSNLRLLEQRHYKPSWTNGLRAAWYGFNIGFSPIKAPFLGSKCLNVTKKALELDPNNWFACIQYGNIYYYTPIAFGGSKSECIAYYSRALKIMESDSNTVASNWHYVELLALLSKVHHEMGNKAMSDMYYQKAYIIAPSMIKQRKDLSFKSIK